MKQLWQRILNEPALAMAIPATVTAAAAAVWGSPALAFLAAAFAGVGGLVTRSQVTPTRKLDE